MALNRQGSLRRELFLLFFILLFLLAAVWGTFTIVISRSNYARAQQQLEVIVEQIIDELAREFASMERLGYHLAYYADTTSFVMSQDLAEQYYLAQRLGTYLGSNRHDASFAEHLLIYDAWGGFYRFTGKLSNTAAAYIASRLREESLPTHLVLDVDDGKYIGYIQRVYGGYAGHEGFVVFLVSENMLKTTLQRYVHDDAVQAVILAHDEPILIFGAHNEPLDDRQIAYTETRHLSITPFSLTINASSEYLRGTTRYFTAAAVATAIIVLSILGIIIWLLNRRFIAPMLQTMRLVSNLNPQSEHARLPMVQSAEFDALINQINDMLFRLENRAQEVQSAKLKLKNSEIEQQKAVIYSLKKQINAHFVVNTLNTMRILMESGDLTEARHVIGILTNLIQYTHSRDEWINAWEEFEVLHQYISIMNIRYNQAIQASYSLDDNLMGARVPRMLLQPIVENAYLHGFAGMEEEGLLCVSAWIDSQTIVVEITDNGKGMHAQALSRLEAGLQPTIEAPSEDESHVALRNIRRRIWLLYGDGGSMSLQSGVQRGMKVTLRLPFMSDTSIM